MFDRVRPAHIEHVESADDIGVDVGARVFQAVANAGLRCKMDDESWYCIRNTPGVTGFVGQSRQGQKPTPLSRREVRTFLAAHPNVHLHYTPTYSSWLNQVELWFSKIERDVIARGIFTSVTDLRRKLMRYIRQYNKTAKPFRWSYADPARRIA